jgi:hypothetical protein
MEQIMEQQINDYISNPTKIVLLKQPDFSKVEFETLKKYSKYDMEEPEHFILGIVGKRYVENLIGRSLDGHTFTRERSTEVVSTPSKIFLSELLSFALQNVDVSWEIRCRIYILSEKSIEIDDRYYAFLKEVGKKQLEFYENERKARVGKCSVEGCEKNSKKGGVCIAHGAVMKRCSVEGCGNGSLKGGVCITHGAITKRCSVEGCEKNSKKGGVCMRHGAKIKKKRCSVEGCEKGSLKGGVCMRHGAIKKRCSVEGCEKYSKKGGVCMVHGAKIKKKRCSVEGCEKYSKKGGVCIAHGAVMKRCSVEGCGN